MNHPQSNLPPSMRRQVKAAAAMQTALQNGADPFAVPAAPVPAAQPVQAAQPAPGAVPQTPAGAVFDPGIPEGFKPVDLTRPAAPPSAPAATAPTQPQPPTNPSSRWVPASSQNAPTAAPAAQPVASQPPPGAQPVGNDGDQRYKVLQGKYNTETRELRGQVNDLIAQNRTLMAALAQRPAAPVPAPVAVPKTPRERALAAGFTEKEIEEYGEELVNIMLRTTENVAGTQIAQLRQDNARLASMVQNTVQTVAQDSAERFWEDLAQLVPDWTEINASQEWLDWLQQPDVFSGRARNDGLQDAFKRHDARRVANIMNAFKAEDARAPTAGANSHVDPATLVAPGQTVSSTPAPAGMGSDADQRIWTEEEVRQFYSAKRRGHLKGENAARVQAEIDKALVEGRIRPTHNEAHLINSR